MLIDDLKAIVGERAWTNDADVLEPHLSEWRGELQGKTLIMLSPDSTAQVAGIMRACHTAGVGVVPQGGNTGLCGGAIPDKSGAQVLLSMSRLNAIRSVDAQDFSLVAEAGCVLANVQEAARKVGRFFPLSLGAEGSCQIGGNLSTNAGGINVLRYGTARQQVLGLEVVLADGTIWDGLRSLRKDTAGYDMKQLFLGSEGTLGVITAATLKIYSDPGETTTVFMALESAANAVSLYAQFRDALGDRIQAFELISDRCLRFVQRHILKKPLPLEGNYSWFVLCELIVDDSPSQIEAVLEAAMENGLIVDAVVAKNKAESAQLWDMRHAISEAEKPEGGNLKHDIALPVGRIGEFLEAGEKLVSAVMPDARLVAFGHVGDGNLHYNVAQPVGADAEAFRAEGIALTHAIYELVASMGGSFSAEHGVGVLKKDDLLEFRGGAELELMRTVKRALDPKNILNPGKVI
jgi:FAD/FMN-containing dehydrogenase